MAKAYIKGTIKKVFDLKSGEGKRGQWTRLDMVVIKEEGSPELDKEPILKIWDPDQLQVYEGATVEAHGKLDEYGGEVRVVANAKDVTVNGGASPTPEQAKEIMTSSSPATLPLSRLAELHGSIGLGAMRCYLEEVVSQYPDAASSPEVIAAAISAGSNAAHTAFIGLNRSAKLEDDLDPDGVPF